MNNIKQKDGKNVVVWLILILFASAYQYIIPAYLVTRDNIPLFWGIPTEYINQAGPLRFIKDFVILLFSFYWPTRVKFDNQFEIYSIWIFFLLLCGSISYIIGTGELNFFLVGLRWIFLLHCSFGIYKLAEKSNINYKYESLVFIFLVITSSLSIIFSILQFRSNGYQGLIGQSRLPGIFSVGGTAGYFALGASIILSTIKSDKINLKLFGYILFSFQAAVSGTRYSLLGCFAFAYSDIRRIVKNSKIAEKSTLIFLIDITFVLIGLAVLFGLLESVIGRGSVIEQFGEGSRISNISEFIDLLGNISFLDFLFGRGLGMGTNSAEGVLDIIDISRPTWQFLTDNTIIVTFQQSGAIGVIVLFGGLLSFMINRNIFNYPLIATTLFIGLFVQNIFEQVFIMLPVAYFVGHLEKRPSTVAAISRDDFTSNGKRRQPGASANGTIDV